MTDDQQQRADRAARFGRVEKTGHSRQLRLRLKRAREARGMGQPDVAREIQQILGLVKAPTPGAISHWENFRRHPPVDLYAAWCRSVGMELKMDIVPEGSGKKFVALSPDVAQLARALEAASVQQRAAIAAVLQGMGIVLTDDEDT